MCKKKDNRPTYTCAECGKQVKRYPSQVRGKTFTCSVVCRNNHLIGEKAAGWKGGFTANCDYCGTEYSQWRNGQEKHDKHFCSVGCKSSYYVGENSQHWKGGIAPFSATLRGINEYVGWKQSVLERDGYRCVQCGEEDHIEVHHIVEFSELIRKYNIQSTDQSRTIKELWDINNGCVLCVHCHAEEHPDKRKFILKKVS